MDNSNKISEVKELVNQYIETLDADDFPVTCQNYALDNKKITDIIIRDCILNKKTPHQAVITYESLYNSNFAD